MILAVIQQTLRAATLEMQIVATKNWFQMVTPAVIQPTILAVTLEMQIVAIKS